MWQYCWDEPDDNTTEYKSFKFKSRFTNNTGDHGTADIEIAMPLKYVGNY